MSETKHTNSPCALELEAGTYHACTCGMSSKFPLCDFSAHKGTGKVPQKFEVAEKDTVYLCRCGKSQNAPYCDGSHEKA